MTEPVTHCTADLLTADGSHRVTLCVQVLGAFFIRMDTSTVTCPKCQDILADMTVRRMVGGWGSTDD